MTDRSTYLSELSNAEIASLSSGNGFWYSKRVGEVPSFNLSDGPHGLRKQGTSEDHLGMAPSVPATCFPPAVALSQTWDADLIERVGTALGEEGQAEGVGVLLGPGINIKRDPRCGRNFEYFSEDPVLAGELGTAWVKGVQSQGVGTSLKHFAANNQEDDRMRVSSNVDERTLREIYLRPFQKVVTQAQPWTVMCSYNKVNGTYASENPWLLTKVLRDEWGFEGFVVSDWGAVANRVNAVKAGLDLQMPYDGGTADQELTAALDSGEIDRATAQQAAERVARVADRVAESRREGFAYDVDAHHGIAREAAARAIVLLKNEGDILPLTTGQRITVIGEFAATPRIQGAGSSRVNNQRLDVPLEELRAQFGAENVSYAQGFSAETDGTDSDLATEAIASAAAADVAILFLGLGNSQESEGFDRTHIELPVDQIELLKAVAEKQENVVVVLTHGAVLRLTPVIENATAILDAALLGQGGGHAVASVLSGAVNPSGKLAETVPVRLEDVPAWGNFPGEHGNVNYGEGQYVGYRWYESRDIAVSYPFGHGLSYTTFEYTDLRVQPTAAGDSLTATVQVHNTGARDGREVVQLYTSVTDSAFERPVKELKAFAVVDVPAGGSATAALTVAVTDLEVWDVRRDSWIVEGGTYTVQVGASSADIRLTGTVEISGTETPLPLHLDSSFGEVMADPVAARLVIPVLQDSPFVADGDGDDALGVDMMKMLASLPLSRLVAMAPGSLTTEKVQAVIAQVNTENGVTV
ncbi:glycoside hydrolase family 3 C-terminal domain-containing protein [Populibacterium corticicola]|uniref:Glycoside hydrolase family 3 C-terminal domain-containing protein n=1 Tax=Populibacterium corticicola TaxID=1812826 RepID=A0ABW5XDH0_9MICO